MKVLHVISGIDAVNGGPSVALAGMTAAQARTGAKVRVVSAYRRPEALEDARAFEAAGVGIRLVGPVSSKLRGYHKDLTSVIREEIRQSDVVHIHAVWEPTQITAARSATQLKKPYVLTPHGMLSTWSMSRRPIQKMLLRLAGVNAMVRNARLINVTTPIELEQTRAVFPNASYALEPYGLALDEFRSLPRRGYIRQAYPQLVGRKVLVHLGRIAEQKGLHVLLPAFAKLIDQYPDWRLVLVGPEGGAYERDRREQAKQLGIENQIIWAGPSYGADRVAALVDSDLFVLASHHENFAIAVAEAMAAKLAVVVSDKVMLHPTITNANAGGVCEQTPDAVAAELSKWMSDADLRKQAGENGRELVLREFDWDVIAARWLERYRQLIASP